MKHKLTKALREGVGLIFALWVIMGSFPTSWICDLWAGTGTGQGQRPSEQVALLTGQEQIQELYYQDTAVTVSRDHLVKCPLMGARDPDMAGEYRSRGRRGRIPQYFPMDRVPAPVGFLFQHFLLNGFYNTYYLAQLEDGTYACVFFDDYILMPFLNGLDLPAGQVRSASTEEKTMLHLMAEDYDVDVAYVVDMYNYEKISWIGNLILRIVLLFVLFLVEQSIEGRIKRMLKKRKEVYE